MVNTIKPMEFEQIWQQYGFTESELLSMNWQFPSDYILMLNYYWELTSIPEPEVATNDQILKLTLHHCIRLNIQFPTDTSELNQHPTHFGTIIGWGQITPSNWIENLSIPPKNWLHLFFDIGSHNRIEALCEFVSVTPLTQSALSVLNS